MTMHDVLDGITALGRKQDRLLKRVKSLEVEVGMTPTTTTKRSPTTPTILTPR